MAILAKNLRKSKYWSNYVESPFHFPHVSFWNNNTFPWTHILIFCSKLFWNKMGPEQSDLPVVAYLC